MIIIDHVNVGCVAMLEVIKISKELIIVHRHYKEITSTQDYAKKISLLSNAWQLISASKQTCGKGQMGRSWVSEQSGNIYATLIIPLDKKYIFCSRMLPQVVAFSIIQVLKNRGFNAKLKWVNDVLIEKKKISGILCEQNFDIRLGLQKLLVGFGVNVNASKEMLIKTSKIATSLLIESGQHIDEKVILYEIVTKIYQNFKIFFVEGFRYFLNQINSLNLLEFKGNLVYLDFNEFVNEKINYEPLPITKGKLIGLSEDGRLILDIGDGKVTKFNSGRLRQV